MQGPKHLHTTPSIRPAPGDPSQGESELSCSRFVVERIHFHCDMKWQRVQSYTELQFWNNWRKNTKGPARMSTADILGHIHNASHIYMHSHTVGMYTSNTHAYTYLSTYHASHICVYTHLYVYAHHACVSQTAWSLSPDAHLRKTGQSKLPGPFQTLPQHHLQKKSSRRPEGPDKWKQVQLWRLAMTEEAKVGAVDEFSF